MKYRSTAGLDDPTAQGGDAAFVGLNSFVDATTLGEGMVSTAKNVRMDSGKIQVRKGLDFLAGSVTLTYSSGTEQVFASGLFSSPADNTEWIIAATKDKAILWNKATASGKYVAFGGAQTITTAHEAVILQSFQKVFIFRKGARPLEWDGVMTDTNGDGTVDSTFASKTASATDGSSGIAMPSVEWGIHFRNRIICPWTADSPNSMILSDILDSNQFPNTGKHYINKGSADELIGISPYAEDQLLIFNRHSVHILNNVTTIASSNTYEITRQYGCVARKTIVQSGPNTYFLSDAGVMVITPGIDPAKGLGIAISKATGEQLPLSAPINDFIETINFTPSVIEKAVSIIHDNKLYLAVPTGSSTDNNEVAVFDLLTNNWVSIDGFAEVAFSVEDFVIAAHGSAPERKRLFITNKTGWYLYEENTLDDSGREVGSTSESGTNAITGQVVTRSYTLGDPGQKRFKRGQVACEVANGDAFTIKSVTREPDITDELRSITATASEENIKKFSIKRPAYACSLQMDVTAGRPVFRHCLVEGTSQYRTQTDVE